MTTDIPFYRHEEGANGDLHPAVGHCKNADILPRSQLFCHHLRHARVLRQAVRDRTTLWREFESREEDLRLRLRRLDFLSC